MSSTPPIKIRLKAPVPSSSQVAPHSLPPCAAPIVQPLQHPAALKAEHYPHPEPPFNANLLGALHGLEALGPYLCKELPTLAKDLCHNLGVTLAVVMAYLVGLPECEFKKSVIRRLLGNSLEAALDLAIRNGRLTVFAARPRVMIEQTLWDLFGLDLRGGRSEPYMNKSTLFNELQKALRKRGPAVFEEYQRLRPAHRQPRAITNIDQSSPITNMNNSSIGFASMAHRSSSMTHGTTALSLGPPPPTHHHGPPANALAPPASSSSSSTEPASAAAIAALDRKLEAWMEQMGAMVSMDAMVSYVTHQMVESEGRAAAVQQSLEARVMAAVEALRQDVLAQQQQSTLDELEGY